MAFCIPWLEGEGQFYFPLKWPLPLLPLTPAVNLWETWYKGVREAKLSVKLSEKQKSKGDVLRETEAVEWIPEPRAQNQQTAPDWIVATGTRRLKLWPLAWWVWIEESWGSGWASRPGECRLLASSPHSALGGVWGCCRENLTEPSPGHEFCPAELCKGEFRLIKLPRWCYFLWQSELTNPETIKKSTFSLMHLAEG